MDNSSSTGAWTLVPAQQDGAPQGMPLAPARAPGPVAGYPGATVPPGAVESDAAIDLAGAMRVLLRRWWIIAALVAFGASGASVYVLLKTPIYKATVRVLVKPTPHSISGLRPVASTAGSDMTMFYRSQQELITSRRIAQMTIVRLGINRIPGEPLATSRDALVGLLRAGTGVKVLKSSHLMEISFYSSDPRFSARVANTLVQAYIDDTHQRAARPADVGLGHLLEKQGQLQVKVETAERAVSAYKDEHGLVDQLGSEQAISGRLQGIEARTGAHRLRLTELEAVRKALAEDPDAIEMRPDLAGGAAGILNALRLDLLKANQALEDMLSRFTRKHPAVKPLLKRIEQIELQIQQELKKINARLSLEVTSLKSELEELGRQRGELESQLSRLSSLRAGLRLLENKAATLQLSYRQITNRIEEIQVKRATQNEELNIDIIDPATEAKAPAYPRPTITIAAGVGAGLLLGLLLVYLLEYLDDTIKSKDEVERRLGVAVLGFVPRVERMTKLRVGDKTIRVPAEKVALLDGTSVIAESFRSIRTGLDYSLPADADRCLLVTSSTPNDGKSLVAANLAASLARTGKRVLLVDADLRRPSQNQIMDIEREVPGLSDLLQGDPDALHLDAVQGSPVDGLEILPAGPAIDNPAELLGTPTMAALVSFLTERYDWVVFDTPPLTVVSDPAVMMTYIPHVLFVIRAFHTQFDRARLAIETIRHTPAKTVRAVLNTVDVPTAFSGQPYYGYSGSQYGYYSRYRIAPGTPAGRRLTHNPDKPAGAPTPAPAMPARGPAVPSTGAPPPAPSPVGDGTWLSLTMAAALLSRSPADTAMLADQRGWEVEIGRGPLGTPEPHYPLESVRMALSEAPGELSSAD